MSERSVSEEGEVQRQLSDEESKAVVDEDDSSYDGGSDEDRHDYEDGFLVPDDEEGEEFRPKKHKKQKHRKDGKKKKRRMKLDPDDIDIIQNDTLMKPSRPKAKKLPVLGSDLDEEDEDIQEGPEEINEVDILPEEEDDDNYGGVTKEQFITALAIFGEDEPDQKLPERTSRLRPIPEEDKSQMTSSKRKTQVQREISIHDLVTSSEYPQRYLRKMKNYVGAENLKVEMEHQITWMGNRLREQRISADPETIRQVLTFIRAKKIDLPFIKQYIIMQIDNCTPELIDSISEIHEGWFGYLSSLQALNFRIPKLIAYSDKFYPGRHDLLPTPDKIVKRMKTLPPQEVIDDYREYILFYLRVFQCEKSMNAAIDKDPEQVKTTLPFHNDLQEAVQVGLVDFAREYMLSPEDMAENIENCYQVKSPCPGVGDPHVPFSSFISKMKNIETDVEVLNRVVKLLSQQLCRQPEILRFFKDQYIKKGFISTNPKEKGKEIMDIYHPLFPAKRISRRPVASFLNDGDILWHYILQAEKQGLIQIEIELSPNSSQELVSDMTKYYQDNSRIPKNGEISESLIQEKEQNLKGWNIIRAEIINAFMKKVEQKVKICLRRRLTAHSQKQVIKKCSDSFERMLLKPPKKHADWAADEKVQMSAKLIVLLINQDEAKQIHRQCAGVHGVVVGRNGELVNDFYLSSFLERRRLPRRDGTAPPPEQKKEARNQESHKILKQKILDFAPDKIVIGANCLEARFLQDKLLREIFPEIEQGIKEEGQAGGNFSDHEEADERVMKTKKQSKVNPSQQALEPGEESFKPPEILMEATHLGQMYSRSSLSQKEVPNLSIPKRVALSIARSVQDPLSQILHNWKEDSRENKILELNLHPLQKYVDRQLLQDGLERRAVSVVNQVGVELTTIRDFSHLSHTVPFISGFGPITAAQFLQKLRTSKTPLCMRMQIYAQALLPESIFLNCAPFLRVKKPNEEQKASKRKKGKKRVPDFSETNSLYHPFDSTRIDVQKQYQIAERLCRSVLSLSNHPGVSEVLEQGGAPLVEYVMANPFYLTNANIDRLRVALFQEDKNDSLNFSESQQLKLIEFLIRELIHPFKDPRLTEQGLAYYSEELHQKEIMLNMIKESSLTFYPGVIATGTIFYVGPSIIRARLDNGLDCIIHMGDCDLPGVGLNQGNGNIEKNQMITGRVKEIQYDQFTAKLNAKLEEVSSHRGYIRAIWPDLDNAFMLLEEDVENSAYNPIKQIEKEKEEKIKVNKRYIPRGIMHPHFKNMTYMKAVAHLTKNDKETPVEKQLNNFVFRPSSSGPDHLTLTWQFFRRNIVHLDIEEHRKKPDSQIGEILVMNGEEYESLDEIITRYIYPCTQIVQDTLRHRKFVMQCTSAEQMKQYIKDEQSKTPNTVQYNFGIFPQFPQHVVLMYSMNQSGRVYVEYIKVKPRGYWFHDQYFQNLERLVYFFKSNQSKPEYQKHAKKMKAPMVVFREQLEVPQAEEEWKGAEKDWIAGEGAENIKNELPKREKTPRQDFEPWGQAPLSETQNVQGEWGSSAKNDSYDDQLKREYRSHQPQAPASSWGAETSAAPASMSQSWGSAMEQNQPAASGWGQATPMENQPIQSSANWGSTSQFEKPTSASGWGSTPQNTLGQPTSGSGGWGSSSGAGGEWGQSGAGGGSSSWGNQRENSSGYPERKRDDRYGDRNRDNRRGRDYGDRGGRGGRDSGYGRGRGDRDNFRGRRGDRERGGRGGSYRHDDSSQGRNQQWGNKREEGGGGGWGSPTNQGGRDQSAGGWNRGDSSREQQHGGREKAESGWGGSNAGATQGWGGSPNQQGQQQQGGSSWGETKSGQPGGWGDGQKDQQSSSWGGSKQEESGGWGAKQSQLGQRSWTASGGEGDGQGGYGNERKQKRFDDDRGDSWGGRNRGRSEGRGGFGGRDDRRGGRGGRGGDFRGGRGGRGGDFRGGRSGGRDRDNSRSQGFGGGRSGGGWQSDDRGQSREGWGGKQQAGGSAEIAGQSGWGGSNPTQQQSKPSSGWGASASNESSGWATAGAPNKPSGGWGSPTSPQQQTSSWGGDQKPQQSSGKGWGEEKQQTQGGWGSGGGGSSWN